jgi:hypothetical protein
MPPGPPYLNIKLSNHIVVDEEGDVYWEQPPNLEEEFSFEG